jgi:hypothetical protein
MRKVISLGLALVVLVVLGVAVHRLEARRIPDWRIELDKYIASRWPAKANVRIHSIAVAREPWNMKREMGHPVSSEGMWASVRLPFPPAQVMCVLLERDEKTPAQGTVYHVVLVCHHSDGLWKHGWVVHEGIGEPFSEALQEQMSALGCDLTALPVDPSG